MNLLLLEESELDSDGRATLSGRRAEHIVHVLGTQPGQALRAGVIDVGFCEAVVVTKTAATVEVRVTDLRRQKEAEPRVLVLALPRPKVLSRCVQHAAALGFTQIALVRCQRSEKAHLSSHRLDAARTRLDCVLGLEQARRVRMPAVTVFTRFKPFVEDSLDALAPSKARFVAHPGGPPARELAARLRADAPEAYTLAIGPEGGFVAFEVEALVQRGFHLLGSALGALRVESALSYFCGQLDAVAPGGR